MFTTVSQGAQFAALIESVTFTPAGIVT